MPSPGGVGFRSPGGVFMRSPGAVRGGGLRAIHAFLVGAGAGGGPARGGTPHWTGGGGGGGEVFTFDGTLAFTTITGGTEFTISGVKYHVFLASGVLVIDGVNNTVTVGVDSHTLTPSGYSLSGISSGPFGTAFPGYHAGKPSPRIAGDGGSTPAPSTPAFIGGLHDSTSHIGGGGAGASADGFDGSAGGNGGAGVANPLPGGLGLASTLAGGGGAGGASGADGGGDGGGAGVAGDPGVANTGGGGGGNGDGFGGTSALGGSGLVVIYYPI